MADDADIVATSVAAISEDSIACRDKKVWKVRELTHRLSVREMFFV